MARAQANTVYLVGLIFAILVSMGLLGVCYKLNEDMTQIEGEIAKYKGKYERENEAYKNLAREIRGIRELVVGDGTREIKKDHYQTTILDQANKRLEEILSEEWVATDDWKQIKDENIRAIWQKMTSPERKAYRHTNLVELYQELLNQLQAVIHIIPVLRYQRIRAREIADEVRKSQEQLRKNKQKTINDLRQQLSKAEDEALRLARDFDTEKKKLQDEKETVLKEVTTMRRDHALQVARLESEKGQLEGRIKQLVKKKEKTYTTYAKPDGEVVYGEAALGYAWINLGTNHGLRPNTRFLVYQFIKGGRQQVKGVLEVRRIEGDMSQCAILQNQEVTDPITGKIVRVPDRNNPVVRGDLIRNPFFDKEEQKVFVFLGKKLKAGQYNLPEIRRKISEAGGKVEKSVSIATHFVVLLDDKGDDFQAKYDRATQFGVIFMRETELLEYLGR